MPPAANISETALDDEGLKNLRRCARNALETLGLSIATRPAEVAAAIDNHVSWWQKKGRPPKMGIENKSDAELLLGSLWGEQLAGMFKWEWRIVVHHNLGNVAVVGILSPDRSLVIYPMYFIHRVLLDPQIDCTIALSFNMLVARKIYKLPARGYVNLMECIKRV